MKNFALLTGLLLSCALMVFAFAAPTDGNWSAASASTGAPQSLTMLANGAVLTGTLDGAALINGKVQGNSVWFNAVRGGVTYNYKGTVSGSQLDLHETKTDGSAHRGLIFNRN